MSKNTSDHYRINGCHGSMLYGLIVAEIMDLDISHDDDSSRINFWHGVYLYWRTRS